MILTMHAAPSWAHIVINAADLTIFHKQPMRAMNRDKIRILPMGVPNFTPPCDRQELREKYGFKQDDKILVSTGFMLPSKEIHDILALLASAILEDPKIKLQLIHSLSPRAPVQCENSYKKVQQTIQRFHLHSKITFITDFIPQQELQYYALQIPCDK